MALTTTTLNGTITAGQSQITLTAYTQPTGANTLGGPNEELQFATGERCLVTDRTNAPTLGVVRGYDGTTAVAHTTGEGVVYGLTSDSAWAFPAPRVLTGPVLSLQAQEITATGATGTTAGVVTPASFAFLNMTGASGAGINLPYPTVGMAYTIKNNGTGALKIYSVGATINGTTGTTAVTLTATGNLTAFANCATAGAWQVSGNT